MKEFIDQATAAIDAPPADVFTLITDVDRLPEWNRAIEAVVATPPALVDGEEWTVTMHPPHMPRWGSISRLQLLDPQQLRFAYVTRNADGNPSFAEWSWTITPDGARTAVTVSWHVHLLTFDRRVFAGPLRSRQLRREVRASLDALAAALAKPTVAH